MFYLAKNENSLGSYLYVYHQRKDTKFKTNIYFSYTINLDQNILYLNDPWPEHILNQNHVKKDGDEHQFLKLLFETNIKKVVEEKYD